MFGKMNFIIPYIVNGIDRVRTEGILCYIWLNTQSSTIILNSHRIIQNTQEKKGMKGVQGTELTILSIVPITAFCDCDKPK